MNELRGVLDQVEVLLENFDAQSAVISADHGECFGEWGIYSHPAGIFHPSLRKVPWVRTSGTENETRTPVLEAKSNHRQSIQEQLNSLGYR